ncbi:T9SS type A sorting domain-containing protein [Alkaliflexus imshenetskii]|uniref:T9SS type A sorting domain-containing protein n=1 Tax=Alkaliflexus imshenetskii TaxID=286730 RepID=UPI00047ABFAE|nr:T9SS type A sorting domain-containing protein [Alkaliflexus imshenetskii]
MNKILLTTFFFFTLALVKLHGQNIAFTYDKAGNRIERKTIPLKSSSFSEAETEQIFEDSLSDQKIQIFPNPTRGHLVVSIKSLEDKTTGKITITDINGRLILTQEILEPNTSLNLSNQPTGYYLMTITLGEESSFWKIVKN